MRVALLLLAFLLTGPASAQIKAKPVPGPNDAIALALQDLQAQPQGSWPYLRYLWVSSGDPEAGQAISFAVNVVSRATTIQRPTPIGAGRLLLQRIDVRHYAPRGVDLQEWLSFWEDFQFDPRFSRLITKGTLKFAVAHMPAWQGRGFVTRWRLVPSEPYQQDGQTFKQKWVVSSQFEDVVLADVKDVELIRIPGPHLDLERFGKLVALTGSQAPVVTDGYFVFRALSAIQDKGVYAIIYGGRYYQFAGIRKGFKKGTDEDNLLDSLGVGNVEAGITAARVFDKLRSDQRAAKFRSGVTGSPRRVDFFRTLAGRIDGSSGLISFTHDLRTQDVDIDTHPIANLLNFKDAAREAIWELRNGLHGYALFDGNGGLQDEAPPDVARDNTIPAPHTARLQPAIGCISCHEASGDDGWRRVSNDIKTMLGAGKLDIFGDGRRLFDPDFFDRAAGLYQGEPERALSRGRDDYALAVLKTTGPWKASKGQTDVVKFAATKTVSLWRGYWYDMVDQERALAELGFEADKKDVPKLLDDLLQPDVRAAVPIGDAAIVPEDFRIYAARVGVPQPRSDWDLAYSFAAERAQWATRKKGK